MSDTAFPSSRRFRKARRAGRTALNVAIMSVWFVVPLLPVIAIALTWYDGLS
jgi:hypothetical protein